MAPKNADGGLDDIVTGWKSTTTETLKGTEVTGIQVSEVEQRSTDAEKSSEKTSFDSDTDPCRPYYAIQSSFDALIRRYLSRQVHRQFARVTLSGSAKKRRCTEEMLIGWGVRITYKYRTK
jgi:hypothetical protein